jgi:hypothetical protein
MELLKPRAAKRLANWVLTERSRTKAKSVVEEHCSISKENVNMSSVAVIDDGVVLKSSCIVGAGTGLFGGKDFDRFDLITEYSGEVGLTANLHTSAHLLNKGYIFTLSTSLYIDGSKAPSKAGFPGGSFANDSRNSSYHPNAKYVIFNRLPASIPKDVRTGAKSSHRMFLVALEPIQTGAEIFVDYGEDYWICHDFWYPPSPTK